MASRKLTRRALFGTGVVSAVAVGAALDESSSAAQPASDSTLHAAKFIKASGARSAVVQLVDTAETVKVEIDSTAFLSHGADGVVGDVSSFVSGEEVAVRGMKSATGIVASEFQSVYQSASGAVSSDRSDYVLMTASGQRVQVPQEVVREGLGQRIHSGIRQGATYSATIWTDPGTGSATAVVLNEAS